MQENEFIQLLQKEEGKLLRIAWAILGQESDAWDALQEAVEQAWRHRGNLKGGSASFPHWIRQILINRAINHLHYKKRLVLMETNMIPEDKLFPSPEEDIVSQDVWETIYSLDENHRKVVVLRYLADLSLQEISVELEVPLSTVKSRLYRALDRLRNNLEVRRLL